MPIKPEGTGACLTAIQPCSCVTSLRNLEMFDGTVLTCKANWHPQGVSVCSVLTKLDCSHSSIMAQDPQKILDLALSNCPQFLSSQLVSLTTWIQSDSEDILDLTCFNREQHGKACLSLPVKSVRVLLLGRPISADSLTSICLFGSQPVLDGHEGPAHPDLT